MKRRKFVSIILTFMITMSLIPTNYAFAAGATGDFTVSGGTLGTDYSYSDNVLTVLKSTKLTISGTTTNDRIVVASGVEANLVLSNLSITTSYTNNSDNSPLSLKDAGESVITLQEGTTNTLDGSGAGNYAPGIFVPNGSLLTIKVKDVTRECGAENPALGVEYTGLQNEETADVLTGELALTYNESIHPETPIGTYVGRTEAKGLSSGNYEIEYVPGNVTITKIGVKASTGTGGSTALTVGWIDRSPA